MKGILCDNVVLEHQNLLEAKRALVIIDNESIGEIVETESSLQEVIEAYPHVEITYHPHSYLMPGLVDSNIKSTIRMPLERLLKRALTGGVTTACIEVGPEPYLIPESILDIKKVLCVGTIEDLKLGLEEHPDVLAIKCYLCKQNNRIKHLLSFDLLQTIYDLDMPLIVDSSTTSERFLYMASPYRGLELSTRNSTSFLDKARTFENYAEATDRDIEEVDSYSSEEENKHTSEDSDEDSSEIKPQAKSNVLIESEIESYSKSGITELKISSGEGSPDTLTSSPDTPTSSLLRSRTNLRGFNISVDTAKSFSRDETIYTNYLLNIPQNWESRGIQTIISHLENTSVRVHFANISSYKNIKKIRSYKKSLNLTCETCPHYVYFSDIDVHPKDTRFKTFPPIRDVHNSKVLISMLKSGKIDMVSSNHNPITPEFKFLDYGEFRRALPGVDVLGFSLQALWTKLFQSCEPSEYSRVICEISRTMSTGPCK